MSSIQLALIQVLSHSAADAPVKASSSSFIWTIFWFAIAVSAVALGAKIALNALNRSDRGIVRSALALILVTALALLAAVVHFDGADPERQTLLLGAVATLASAVVAFYFSSRSAESARKDLLSAMSGGPQMPVPNLVGMTVAEARSTMSASSLSLSVPQGAPDAGVIATQTPPAQEVVSPLQTVTVTLVAQGG
ncbi:PASTA domain-containing protein [Streptomyces olivoreticuli]|uniref:PASTA domain-containing protein n=1 Tax=Streptomyces olivoreticuli TaxID=68246 RepID=UPI000E276563|nr:PASTA domain-containing protein [Streptomyces olivoreticuli]